MENLDVVLINDCLAFFTGVILNNNIDAYHFPTVFFYKTL